MPSKWLARTQNESLWNACAIWNKFIFCQNAHLPFSNMAHAGDHYLWVLSFGFQVIYITKRFHQINPLLFSFTQRVKNIYLLLIMLMHNISYSSFLNPNKITLSSIFGHKIYWKKASIIISSTFISWTQNNLGNPSDSKYKKINPILISMLIFIAEHRIICLLGSTSTSHKLLRQHQHRKQETKTKFIFTFFLKKKKVQISQDQEALDCLGIISIC